MMNKHTGVKRLISTYYDGETTVQEAEVVEKHIQECPECKQYYQELQGLSSSLNKWTDENLSPDLEQKIMKDLLDSKKREGLKMKKRTSSMMVGAGSAVVILAAFVVVGQIYRYQNDAEQIAINKRIQEASQYMEGTQQTERRLEKKVDAEKLYTGMEQQKSKKSVLSRLGVVKSGVRGRMKGAADDIGGQFSPGNTSVVTPRSQTSDRFANGPAVGTAGGDGDAKSLQYQPYYLESEETDLKNVNGFYALREDVAAPTSEMWGGGDIAGQKRMPAAVASSGPARQAELGKTKARKSGALQSFNLAHRSDGKDSRDAYTQTFRAGREIDGDIPVVMDKVIADRAEIILKDEYEEIYRGPTEFHTEEYDLIYENEFLDARENPLSTFSIDVDTASYSNMRRFLSNSQLPPKDAVRIEELVNYFNYDYPSPDGKDPFSITIEGAPAPWNPNHQLVMVGLQGKQLKTEELPSSNLVFLVDVSGSMDQPNKLPLLQNALKFMVNNLRAEDHVSMVVYAGSAGMVLNSTPGDQKARILQAIDSLKAGGSTAGGAGVQLAYQIAKQNFIKGGNNRVILATDGDFNVGVSSDAELVRIIEKKRRDGIFLTILGFGTGNYKDAKMEKLADKGNGNYFYIDTIREAKKVLVQELGSVLFTIAKDVKIQIEFNPAQVKAYRLLGYENRILAKEDFNDDTKDAGELGAGHSVTAFYELIPAGSEEEVSDVDELVYQDVQMKSSSDLMTIKLRYKKPDEDTSKLIKQRLASDELSREAVSDNFNFASAVVEFGLVLRGSQYKGNASYTSILKRAKQAKGSDAWGYRDEFIGLVEQAEAIDTNLGKPGIMMFKGGQQE